MTEPGSRVALVTIAREWGRIGITGFGGPPVHIALLRKLCVDQNDWMTSADFEDAIAATNMLPGPASTQLAIFCAWRLRGWVGAVIGGLCFIVPGLVLIVLLSSLFLAAHPPWWILAAAAGAGGAVPAIAISAGLGLTRGSWARTGERRSARRRWVIYLVVGIVAGALVGPYLVIVLIVLGVVEIGFQRDWRAHPPQALVVLAPLPLLVTVAGFGGLLALVWVAAKVGALSYGGGFVIIPLMQHDAVVTYHWMTNSQFLNAVALGQVTPGPVVLTVAAVGYAAAGLGGSLLAALVAFAPSFVFVLAGGRHFDRLRGNVAIQAFLTGAGAAVVGAILGSSIPLAVAFAQVWQLGILAGALAWLLLFRRGVVSAILIAAALGVGLVWLGAPLTLVS